MSGERVTRGRLSSLDLIPEEGHDDIVWAMAQLNERKRSQEDIRFELNDRLAVKGIDAISKSAFNRRAVRIALAQARREEDAAVYEAIAAKLSPEKIDEAAIVVGELLKSAIAAHAERDAMSLSSEDVLNLAKGYQAAVMAMSQSAEYKRKRMAEFAAKVDEAADAVKKAPGITAETRKKIMEQLGVVRADLQKGG